MSNRSVCVASNTVSDSPSIGLLIAMTNPGSVPGLGSFGAITLTIAQALRIAVSYAQVNLCACFRPRFPGWKAIG